MQSHLLPGYNPGALLSPEQLSSYSAVLPHFVTYIFHELIETHVLERRRRAARQDTELRLQQLLQEHEWNLTVGRPDSVSHWHISQRDHAHTRKDPDLRRRRKMLPEGPVLLREYEDLRLDLKPLLARRRGEESALPEATVQEIVQRYPELDWSQPQHTVRMTPSVTARQILAHRYEVSAEGVNTAIKKARRGG